MFIDFEYFQAKGKIVVFDQAYVSYGVTVAYRDYGAYEASKVGGVASLIRSIAPFSINSPHTGWQDYKNGTVKVPTACITIEDAEMLSRMAARGDRIVIHLYMEAQNLPPATSRNTVAEIVGTTYPEQVYDTISIGSSFAKELQAAKHDELR
jgi:carboxypeptidase Q